MRFTVYSLQLTNRFKTITRKRLSLAILLFSACANIVTPTGGPKDEQPPKVITAVPENASTGFTWNKITITFDEYIRLDNPAQEVVISPTIQPEPKMQVKGKRLEIDFKNAKLDTNTTYTINFGESLKDVHESNPLSGFQYVFSTGEALDSLTVSGKVMQAMDGKPAQKVLVMLHTALDDSSFLKNRPFYFARTDAAGNFSFSHLRHGNFRLYALKDENFTYIYDLPNEEIAFLDSLLVLNENKAGLSLSLFREERELPLKRLSFSDSKLGYIKLIFSKRVEELEVNSVADGMPIAIPEFNTTRDTITAWYMRAVDNDSLRLIVNKDSVEELFARNVPAQKDSLGKMFASIVFAAKDSLIGTEGKVTAVLSHPMQTADFSRVTLEQDSPRIAIITAQIQFAEGTARRLMLDFPRKAKMKYTLIFPAGMFTDYFGNQNDTLTWQVRAKGDEDYGSLKITVTGRQNRPYVLLLVHGDNGIPVKEHRFTSLAYLELDKVSPGSYEIRIIYDSNSNGRWDTGSFAHHRQPETTYAHPEKINVRANWEMEAELKVD